MWCLTCRGVAALLLAMICVAASPARAVEARDEPPPGVPDEHCTLFSCFRVSQDGGAGTVSVGAGSSVAASESPTAGAGAGPAVRTRCVALQPGGGEGFDESSHLDPAQMAARVQIPPSARVAGQMYAVYCQRSDDATGTFNLRDPLGVFTPRPAQPAPDPAEALAARALSQITLPTPTPSTAPPRNIVGLVGIATWLWIEPSQWTALSATAAAGGISVTATATPVRTVWDLGEGHGRRPVTCHGPGTPYRFGINDDAQRTWCSYTFTWASDDHRHDDPNTDTDDLYHAQASIVWNVGWQASTGRTGTLADMTTSTAFDLSVGEIQAVVCSDTPLGQCNPTA
jgi:hypothetical protein